MVWREAINLPGAKDHYMKTVRWAILGAGKIANSFVKDFPLVQNAALVAVAASDPQRAKDFAARNNIPLSFDYETLYNSSEVDAVYIATTHNFHFEQARQCLLHGKAVLCEKPITVNDTQFKELARLAAERKVFLMEAVWTYFLPAVEKALEWVNGKVIGEITLVQSDFGFVMEKDFEGRLYNPNLAGGALLDLGIYPIAMARYFTGQAPEKVQASGTFTTTGVDETLAVNLQYPRCIASLCTSLNTQLGNTTRIFGEKGFIEIPTFWKSSAASVYDKDGNMLESFQDGRTSHGFVYEIQHATNLILAGEIQSPVIPHSISVELQETMTEIRRQIGLKYPFE